MTAPLLKDVFDIPEATGAEDYVLRLTDATTGRGARDAIDNFKAFRGREPKIDALLRHQGMA